MGTLIPFWFIVITVLWTVFFILEGFDFGVGMLHSVVGGDEAGRRAAINTIGPLWDGNEVWLIVAGAAMFAAFPGWYATMFSGLYLALALLLASLIIRGVAFEYRGKRDAARWRRTWDWLLVIGSVLGPLLIGVALGDLLHGLPINASQDYTGSFWDLLQPYGVFTGVTLVLACLLHGATFLSLKTTGVMRERSRRLARAVAPVTGAFVIGFIAWTHVTASSAFFLNVVELLAIIAVLAAVWLAWEHRDGFAFAATTVTIASSIASIFVNLYPNVMVSSTSPANNLTVHNTASDHYSLTAMTVVVVIFLPLVLLYQAWAYYVFRRRVSREQFTHPEGAPHGRSLRRHHHRDGRGRRHACPPSRPRGQAHPAARARRLATPRAGELVDRRRVRRRPLHLARQLVQRARQGVLPAAGALLRRRRDQDVRRRAVPHARGGLRRDQAP
jgi:cytochrome bd ubiquinol oxidase subunit II